MTRLAWLICGLVVFAHALATAQSKAPEPAVTQTLIVKPSELRWRKLPQFADGRERVDLVGVPEEGGTWVYRVRLSRPIRVEAHTHPVDELITVLAGNWSFGLGRKFAAEKLVALPPGSFVRIPANTPHFVATGPGTTIIQSSGTGVFATVSIN